MEIKPLNLRRPNLESLAVGDILRYKEYNDLYYITEVNDLGEEAEDFIRLMDRRSNPFDQRGSRRDNGFFQRKSSLVDFYVLRQAAEFPALRIFTVLSLVKTFSNIDSEFKNLMFELEI